MRWAVIQDAGDNYLIEVDSPEMAQSLADKGVGGTEVEDALGIEMPPAMQWDGNGADWLRAKARAAGMNVI